MLARTFKTAAELKLRDREYTALCKVLDLFEQEKVVRFPLGQGREDVDVFANVPEAGFNMNTWQITRPCGTVACIGGWANTVSDKKVFVFPTPNRDLNMLFTGSNYVKSCGQITVAEAARCLRHYLTTGEVNWNKAINENY